MNKTTSIYLDLLRFISAILVFFSHASYSRFDGAWLEGIGVYGHDAVMVFFVLSGFVIAYVSNTKESTVLSYSTSRLARLYSVVVPALIITLVLDHFGQTIDASTYTGEQYQASEPIMRVFASLFFVNELWFTSIRTFSNGPFWSLSYEFWFYAIYAALLYFAAWKKWLLAGAIMLIAGPKILMLFPVWLLGVATFHVGKKVNLSEMTSICLAILPVVVYFQLGALAVPSILMNQTVEWLGYDFVYESLKHSRRFLTDYIVAILLAIHLLGMISLSRSFSFPAALEKPIRYLAGMTFSLYLFHYPFLQFYGSLVKDGVIIVVLTFVSILLIAPYTEGKKKAWSVIIEKVLSALSITGSKPSRG